MAIRRYKFKQAMKTLAAVTAGGILVVVLIKMLLPLAVALGVGLLVIWLIVYALRS